MRSRPHRRRAARHNVDHASATDPTEIVTTPLEGPLKREIVADGAPYTVTITPIGMSLVLKGRRKGFEMQWRDLVSGEAALAAALNASLTSRLDPSAAGAVKAKKQAHE
jgi:hypothetical protein